MKAAQADQANLTTGGTHEEILNRRFSTDQSARRAQGRPAQSRRVSPPAATGRSLCAEVQQAEEALQRAQADATLLEQKQKDRYSKPEAAKVHAQGAEAQAAYEAAADALSKSSVRSPFDGIVYTLPVKQGAYVQIGDLLLQEGDLSKMLVRSFVDEPEIGRLVSGQKIEVTWDAVPGRIWNGAVSTIPSTVKLHGARNVGEVTCTVDNHDLRLLPNVNVGVTVITAEHGNVLTLPREAVRMDDTKPYVYQVVNGELKRRDVESLCKI